jgi:hypothetical protein
MLARKRPQLGNHLDHRHKLFCPVFRSQRCISSYRQLLSTSRRCRVIAFFNKVLPDQTSFFPPLFPLFCRCTETVIIHQPLGISTQILRYPLPLLEIYLLVPVTYLYQQPLSSYSGLKKVLIPFFFSLFCRCTETVIAHQPPKISTHILRYPLPLLEIYLLVPVDSLYHQPSSSYSG